MRAVCRGRKRIGGSKYRIKSVFIVGRYKVPLLILVGVLVLMIPVTVIGAFGFAARIVRQVIRVVVCTLTHARAAAVALCAVLAGARLARLWRCVTLAAVLRRGAVRRVRRRLRRVWAGVRRPV